MGVNRRLRRLRRPAPNRCAFAALAILFFAFVPAGAAGPRQWSSGKLIEISHKGDFYEYTVFDGTCGYVGSSSRPLRVTLNSQVKFAIQGSSFYIADDKGKPKKIRFKLQFLAPPPPPPRPKNQ